MLLFLIVCYLFIDICYYYYFLFVAFLVCLSLYLLCYLTCRWYDKHLELCNTGNADTQRVSIVLLTNDNANKDLAQKDGIEVYTGKFVRI